MERLHQMAEKSILGSIAEGETTAAVRFGSEFHRAGIFFGNLSGELGRLPGAFKGLAGQFSICGMIACAVLAGGYGVGMRGVIVKFRGLGMFALMHDLLLLKRAIVLPVSRVFHRAAGEG